jgi:hypothetical protein
MVQKLRQQWDCLTFQPGEDVDDFALCLSGLVQQLAYHNDGVINEPKVVEMYLLIVPKKYTQIALSLENLLDPSTLSIEEVMGVAQGCGRPCGSTTYQPRLCQWRAALHRGVVAGSPEGEKEAGGFVFVQGSSPTTAQEEQ